jgi:hypothetical chaperone protein
MSSNACGVDFGTSNSTVGWQRPGQPALLTLEDGKTTLPSVVFFNADEDTVSVGRAAIAEYLEGYEGRLMRSLKSLLGTGLMNGQTEVQGRSIRFMDLLAMFIDDLKKRAEKAAGRRFEQVVLGRPVFFVDDDPAADKLAQDTLEQIARQTGFSDIEFQYEPIAAAFDYESRIEREELVLVVDIGGGTSDFTLIKLSPALAHKLDRRDDILANCGVHIGGTDFDKQLNLAAAMPLLGLGTRLKSGADMPSSPYFNLATWHTINFAYTRQAKSTLQSLYPEALEKDKLDRLFELIAKRAGHWLAIQVENAKIALSSAEHTALSMSEIEAGLEQVIHRSEFDLAVGKLIDTIESTVAKLLVDAGVKAEQVDTIFFTGGASGIPLLRARIASLLPSARAVEGDLHGSIGSGLALDAARRFA